MFVDVLRMASILDIRRTRQLPFPGTVLVAEGDQVNPQDVIAETALPKETVVLDIAHGLGLSQDEAQLCVVRAVGETVAEGDILAQCEKPLSRLVRSPVDGNLVEVSHGQVVIAAGERIVQVKAGMIGEIAEVLPEFGAVIYAHGSLLQGVWGNGNTGMGKLHWLESAPSKSIEVSALADVEPSEILAGGLCCQASLLEHALEKDIAGMIFNAMAPELLSTAMALPFPVIVLSGLGSLPLNVRIADLLQSQSGETVCVNASDVDEIEGGRPEVIIPQEGKLTGESLGFKDEITIGRRVRVVSGPFSGEAGEIEECRESPYRFTSGLEVSAAVIRLEDGRSVTAPQRNLIILE